MGRFLLVTAIPIGGDEPSLFGFVTPRYVGKAHDRNLTRRRLREIVKAVLPSLRPGHHVVTLARRSILNAEFSELGAEWRKLARRSRILESNSPATDPPVRDSPSPQPPQP